MIVGPHLHLWTKSIDGAEFANALYTDDSDAALNFLGVIKNVTKNNIDNEAITIEDVMDSLTEGRGMYAGVPGFVVVLSRCDGGCQSPSWN
mgnify:CR=1 FL=1